MADDPGHWNASFLAVIMRFPNAARLTRVTRSRHSGSELRLGFYLALRARRVLQHDATGHREAKIRMTQFATAQKYDEGLLGISVA